MPPLPRTVTIVDARPFELDVRWVPGFGSVASSWLVRATAPPAPAVSVRPPASARSATLTGLEPATVYTVCVNGFGIGGAGQARCVVGETAAIPVPETIETTEAVIGTTNVRSIGAAAQGRTDVRVARTEENVQDRFLAAALRGRRQNLRAPGNLSIDERRIINRVFRR